MTPQQRPTTNQLSAHHSADAADLLAGPNVLFTDENGAGNESLAVGPSSEEREQHEAFLSALERYGTGSTGREWERMAATLGWTIAEVRHGIFHLDWYTRNRMKVHFWKRS